jgi:hypothetical protein
MAMQPVYLVSVGNLPKFLEALRHAQAPEKLTLRFIEELGFTSTNDRLFVPLLKSMKFVDDAGRPTGRYHAFLDDTQWKTILAEGIKDAYPDLFRVNRQAHILPRDQLAGKIKSLSEGKASPAVLKNTVKTFIELVKLADFTGVVASSAAEPLGGTSKSISEEDSDQSGIRVAAVGGNGDSVDSHLETSNGVPTLIYRIEIVLPAVRDQAVYDAIFQSARRHLLR